MKIKLDGKEVELKKLDLNDFVEIEKRFKEPVKTSLNPENISMEKARFLIYLMVHKSDSSLTEEKIGELLVPGTEIFTQIMSDINSAIANRKS